MTSAPDHPSFQHSSEHPSFLALDRAALGHAPAAVTTHVAACDRCGAYVGTAREAATSAAPPAARAAPPGGLALVRQAALERRRRRLWRGWSLGAGGFVAAAAACTVLLVVGTQSQQQRHVPAADPAGGLYLGSKGLPSVWIYVKRDGGPELWDGKKPLASGDRLRVKVDPGGHDRVQVYAMRAGDNPALLYGGRITQGQGTILPDAWEVDASPGPERLFVVLANRDVLPAWDKWLRGEVESDVSLLPFVLPKAASDNGGTAKP
jgi:hypothetical protein